MERLVLDLLLLGTFLGVSALLAGAEAAYFSLTRLGSAHLEPDESPEHALLVRVLRDPRDLLVTLLVGITLVNIAASALATQVATTLFGSRGIGDRDRRHGLPHRRLRRGPAHDARGRACRTASACSWRGPCWLSSGSSRRSASCWATFTHFVSQAADGEGVAKPAISEAELRTLVDVGAQEGVVERTEREMIHKVFELEDTIVREVMVPRTDMFCLDVATPPDRLLPASARAPALTACPSSRRPSITSLGILYTKDLLPYLAGCRPTSTSARTSPALLRARVQAGRRAAARVPGQEAPPGHRGGRVRRHGGARHPRGPPRGAGRRDPRRVRRGGAPDPAGGRAHLPRVAAKLPIDDFNAATGLVHLRRALRHGRGLGPRPLRPRAPQGREASRPRASGSRWRRSSATASSRCSSAWQRPRARDPRRRTGPRCRTPTSDPGARREPRGHLRHRPPVPARHGVLLRAEMAFIAANRVRLRHLAEQGSRVARGYLEAFQQPERLLSTAMMGVTIAHISLLGGRDRGPPLLGRRPASLWATVDPHAADAGLRRDHPEGGGPAAGHRAGPPHLRPARGPSPGSSPRRGHRQPARPRDAAGPRARRAPGLASSSPARSSSSCSSSSRRRPTSRQRGRRR